MKKKKYNIPLFIIFPLVSGLFILLIWSSFKWASFSKNIKISSIKITGNELVPVEEYRNLIESFNGASTFSVDLRKISSILENCSHVKSARVSHTFPNGLLVEINERKPIAMVNATPPLFLDRQGFLFPLRGSFSDYSLPVLSHFLATENSYHNINKNHSKSMIAAKQILHFLADKHPPLFDNISELRLNHQEDFEIILIEQPTKVILGKNQLAKKLSVLMKFIEQLQLHRKNITDYKKLDLRFDNQVVAREWT